MKIRVTAEHIKAGCKNSAFNCPIAKAIQAATNKEKKLCSVGDRRCSIWRSERDQKGAHPQLPPIARQFIADFDAGKPVQPFEFEIPYEVPG